MEVVHQGKERERNMMQENSYKETLTVYNIG